ncbi:hypothetical protein GMSM_34350 [Geomonas sp. Red276]
MPRNLVVLLLFVCLLIPGVSRGDVLTYAADPNGSVSGPTPQSVASGELAQPVTASPVTPGYRFYNWTWPSSNGDGAVFGSIDNPLVFRADGKDHELTANFVVDTGSKIRVKSAAPLVNQIIGGATFTVVVADKNAKAFGVDADLNVIGDGGYLWYDLEAIAAGPYYVVGSKSDHSWREYGRWLDPVSKLMVGIPDPPDLQVFSTAHGGTKKFAAGAGHLVALMNDGSLYFWKVDNTYGQGEQPADLNGETVIDVAAGDYFTVALTSGNKLVAWGKNDKGELALAADVIASLGLAGVTVTSTGTTDKPVMVTEGLPPLAKLEAKLTHTVALTGDGRVICWGGNEYGQSSPPAGLGPVSQIAAGGHHTVALLADGTVTGWGDNKYGQISFPVGLKDITLIGAGTDHTFVSRGDRALVGFGRNQDHQTDTPEAYFDSGPNYLACTPVTVSYNGSTVCTITDPDPRYNPRSMFANGVPITMAGNSFTLNNVTALQTITLSIGNVPPPPVSATAVKGVQSAMVSFSPSPRETAGVTGYTVSSTPSGGIDTAAGTTSTNHYLSNLTNGTSYTFTVVDSNINGTGLPSFPSNPVTPQGDQEITVTQAPTSAIYGNSFTVAGTAPGGPVVYTTSGGCTNTGATVTMTSGSTPCTVYFDQPGGGAYNPAVQATKTVAAVKADQALNIYQPAPLTAPFATSFTTCASAPGGAISYASTGGCSNVSGTFTMTSGTTACSITYRQAGNDNYNPVQQTVSVPTSKIAQFLAVTGAPPGSAPYGSSFTVAASAAGGDLAFSASGGCSNSDGTFTMTSGISDCTVRIDQGGNGNYLALSRTFTVTANRAAQNFTVVDPAPQLAVYGMSFTVSATAPGGAVTYSSAGGCTNSAGVYTMTSGTTSCTVRFDQAGNQDYLPGSSSITVTAGKAGQAITVSTAAPTAAVFGDSFTVAASAPAGGVSYSSSGGCSNNGALFTMTSGTTPCTVRYDQGGDADYGAAVRITSTTTAARADQSISVTTAAPVTAQFGTGFTVAATAPAGNVTFGSSGGCTNSAGNYAMTSGSTPCTVTVDQPGDANYNPATRKTSVTAATKASQGITVTTPAPSSAPFGSTFTVAATAPGGGVTYSAAGGCSNSGASFTMTSGTDPCTVYFDQSGSADYGAVRDSLVTTATKGSQAITVVTPAPATAFFGASFTVAANSALGTVSYSSGGGCSNNGAVFTMTSGTLPCTVRYDQAAGGNYLAAPQITSTTTAAKAPQAISVATAAPSTAAFGSSFTVAAGAPGGTVTYNSAGGCSNSGAVFTMTSGTTPCTVRYDQPGSSNYAAASPVFSTTVATKAAQSITVTTPAPSSGTAGVSFTVAATAPGGTVGFATSGGCTNSGATVTITGTGPCTVIYSQEGSVNYSAANPVSSVTNSGKADQVITVTTPPPAVAPYGASFTVAATAPGGPVAYSSSGGCTNSGGTFSVIDAGTPCLVIFDQEGDATTNPATRVTTSTSTQKADQAISIVTPAPASAQFGTSFTVAATAPGGQVVYGSFGGCSNSGPTYTVTSGTVPCTVLFDRPASTNYNAAPQKSSETAAAKADQAITITSPAPASAAFGATFSVAATAPRGAVVYASQGGCTNAGATFTMTSGSLPCAVFYDNPGDADYAPAPRRSSTTAAARVEQAITVTSSAPASAPFGGSFTVAATAPGGQVTYGSSGGCTNNGGVFTVTSASLPCTVTYDQAGDGNYAPAPRRTTDTSTVPTLPGSPVLGVISAANGEAVVAFTAPDFDGGSWVTGYTVTANPGNITATGSGNRITVTGLTNGTAYTFTVRASNRAGTGGASAVSAPYTPYPNGDLNGDGAVDLADVLLAMKLAVGGAPTSAVHLARGDVGPLAAGKPRCDGRIDVGDVTVLLRKTVGLASW